MMSWFTGLTRHIPPNQLSRYLLVGVCNTLFGYGLFAILTAVFDQIIRHGYVLASIVCSLPNITVAYLGYKWFVFKTKGNYLHEWIRCLTIYSGGTVLGVILLPGLVFVIRGLSGYDQGAPYIAGALMTGINVVFSFLGHKRFSFHSLSSCARTVQPSTAAELQSRDGAAV
jgi:putative flippase GtrA